jgi:hypothetical protein
MSMFPYLQNRDQNLVNHRVFIIIKWESACSTFIRIAAIQQIIVILLFEKLRKNNFKNWW